VRQGGKQAKGLKRVKDTYESVADYLGVFEPLLFEEVKSQIVRGRSDEEEGGEGGRRGTCLSPPRVVCSDFSGGLVILDSQLVVLPPVGVCRCWA
jgi:hypothetical protein